MAQRAAQTGALMQFVHRRRRGAELFLLVLALIVGVGAYACVGLGVKGKVPADIVSYGGWLAALIIAAHITVRMVAPYADPVLLPIVAALNGIGLAVIHRIDLALATHYARQQLIWMTIGVGLFIATLVLLRDHRVLQRFTYTCGLAAIVLLLLPMAPVIGKTVNGARIWIHVGSMSFQPGEVAKVLLVITFAGYLVLHRDALALAGRRVAMIDLPRGRDLGPILAMWVVSLGILVFQHDLGSSLLFFGLFLIMLYVATERAGWLVVGGALFIGGAYLTYAFIGHVQERFLLWWNVWAHYGDGTDDKGRQTVETMFGMAYGGLIGRGLGQGSPWRIPFAQSDFIFGAIGEELGLTGSIAIIVLYGLIVERALRAALICRDDLGKLLATGLAGAIALQVFVVIGGVTHLIPLTGLTTPFLSYGGSSLVANWVIIAILLRISDAARRPPPDLTASDDVDMENTQVVKLDPLDLLLLPRFAPPSDNIEGAPGMNKPIRTVSIFCLLLFLALALNATYLQYYHANALNDRVGNGRVATATFSRDRGAILAGGQVVAESVPTKDQYKFQRKYRLPFMYAPVTGWYTFGNETGVERAQNSFLSGEDDRLFVNRLVDLVNGTATKGGNVVLTIDPAAQKAAFDGLSALGPDVQGAVVAMEPATGKILAMVSLPTYDPNKLADHDFKAASAYATRMSKLPGDPLLNRAVQTTLPPGSTFKTVTASAAMQTGRYTASSLVPGGPSYRLPGSTKVVHNEIPNCGTTKIPFTQAMAFSCNTSFAPIAVDVGSSGMRKTADGFGFNQKYLEDTQYPTQAISLYPSGLDDAQTALTGFGQGSVTATPLQMAMVAAGIGNRGVVMRPYLIDELQSPSQEPLVPGHSEELSQAISATSAAAVTRLMVATVQEGTAQQAAIPGVVVAGKTGTAESGRTNPDGSEVPPYAWFVSFAPASSAKVAVAVMIQHVNKPTNEIAGGALGGPIAKSVMEAVLRSNG